MSNRNVTWFLVLVLGLSVHAMAEAPGQIQLVGPAESGIRIDYGLQRLADALSAAGWEVTRGPRPNGKSEESIIQVRLADESNKAALALSRPESFVIQRPSANLLTITGADPAGAMYGCLELATRVTSGDGLPRTDLEVESPTMTLRGTCILLMKLGSYDYPVTPEEFPFFYDKEMWIEYLDFLADNRFNYISFWNGHPFAYFVELLKFPEAQEGMSPELLKRNHDMLAWLSAEADRRNIWLMFQFYQIHTSVYFAKAHGLDPHGSTRPTPLLTDYTMYCIERFVSEFPNVGLYICPGERLQLKYTADWINNVIFAAVKNTGQNPPIMVRSWGIDLPNVKKVAGNYEPLYTERKFNIEHIASTQVDPANREWAQVTSDHVVNIHCMGNLEPFRWNPPSYIQQCVTSSINDGLGTGLHLFPRKAWRWPHGSEKGEQQQDQWDRDWLWFEAWARYAWNPEREADKERAYWLDRVGQRYGEDAAEDLLAAYEKGADFLPAVQRLFWLGHDNHTTAVSGMTLEQIQTCKGIHFLEVPDMIRMPQYLDSLVSGTELEGTTPVELFAQKVAECEAAHQHAVNGAKLATRNRKDAERIATDAEAMLYLARFYHEKIQAAVAHHLCVNSIDMRTNLNALDEHLTASIQQFRKLTELTLDTYESISDVPMWYPIPGLRQCPYHWSDILPYYEQEWETIHHNADFVRRHPHVLDAPTPELPVVDVESLDPNQKLVTVSTEAKPYTDRDYPYGSDLPPEFIGLHAIQISNSRAKVGTCPVPFKVGEPVRVFVAFENEQRVWADLPKDWTLYRGGYRFYNTSAEIGYRDFPAGESKIQFPRGTFVILGFTKQSAKLAPITAATVKAALTSHRLRLPETKSDVPGPQSSR